MKLIVQIGRGNDETILLRDDATLRDLKNAVLPRVSEHRKSFKIEGKASSSSSPAQGGAAGAATLSDSGLLRDQGVVDGSRVVYKDLGPQVGYRTVFVVEYAGPIAIMLLYWLRPALIFGAGASARPLLREQVLYGATFIAHFVKRELETFFVHKFSRPTMPMSNLFKNSIYYWSFAAVIGYVLMHPQYTPIANPLVEQVALAGWAASELLNFAVHYQLSNMRGVEGDKTRRAPRGGLFSLCSCPNYTFEVLGWAFYSAGSGILGSWVFTAVGFAQMAQWALAKHKAYVRDEPDLKKRGAIVPFLL